MLVTDVKMNFEKACEFDGLKTVKKVTVTEHGLSRNLDMSVAEIWFPLRRVLKKFVIRGHVSHSHPLRPPPPPSIYTNYSSLDHNNDTAENRPICQDLIR